MADSKEGIPLGVPLSAEVGFWQALDRAADSGVDPKRMLALLGDWWRQREDKGGAALVGGLTVSAAVAPDGQPIIPFDWGPMHCDATPAEARAMAVVIAGTAEQSETEAFLGRYFASAKDKKMGEAIRASLVTRLRDHRKTILSSWASSVIDAAADAVAGIRADGLGGDVPPAPGG